MGNQRSDTPDQSAARSTTLGHFLQRSNEREGEQKENSAANKQRGEVRVALEILDQSTARKTRHNTRGTKSRERAGRRGRGKAEQRQNRNNRRRKGAGAKDTERRGRTTHQSAQEDEKKERSRKGRAKVVTP